jgi:hypothetical protein
LKKLLASFWPRAKTRHNYPKPQGPEGVRILGHREYVGGAWREIGNLQFEYLVNQGLRPEHYLIDIACGSLRGGVHFVRYLEPGHYLGIEKEASLVQAGIDKELSKEVYNAKKPELVVSSTFEFTKFSSRPHFALAQSLFTHLPPKIITDCFHKLRDFIREDGVFYATYFEAAAERKNPPEADDHAGFFYTRKQMCQFGESTGWRFDYVGDWSHPRRQVMIRYFPI